MTQPASDMPEEYLLGQYIPLHYHFNMLQDAARMQPFHEAIDLVVPVGGTVLELGGGTGVLSWFAAQKARKVWCVERNPALVRASRSFLEQNLHGDRVSVILADALTWLPPEPVDVVICEMLHVGLVREKQLEILQSFQERYRRAYGPKLPRFIPDTTLLAIQPIEQDFYFHGYTAPVPLFQPPGPHMEGCLLGDPHLYSSIDYGKTIPLDFRVEAPLTMQRAGVFNALSFLTNNVLAFVLSEQRAVQWLMNQLILPLGEPLTVAPGDVVTVNFAYRAGCPIEALQESLRVEHVVQTIPLPATLPQRRAA